MKKLLFPLTVLACILGFNQSALAQCIGNSSIVVERVSDACDYTVTFCVDLIQDNTYRIEYTIEYDADYDGDLDHTWIGVDDAGTTSVFPTGQKCKVFSINNVLCETEFFASTTAYEYNAGPIICGEEGPIIGAEEQVPLPIELASFTGKAVDEVNLLEWYTASEINTSYFVIEHSIDGKNNWEAIAQINAAGTTDETQQYSIEDRMPTPLSYYQIRTVDLDGQYRISSDVVAVERTTGQLSVSGVYPVPTYQNEVTIFFETVQDQAVIMTLTDLFGKEISKLRLDLMAGVHSHKVDLTGLDNNIYFISLYNGKENIVEKIIKLNQE